MAYNCFPLVRNFAAFVFRPFIVHRRRSRPDLTMRAASCSIAALMLLFAGCASLIQPPRVHQPYSPEEFGKEFPPEELRSDVDRLVRVMQDVHPNLYASTPKSRIDSARWRIKRDLTTPLTRDAFYTRIAPLVALVGDAHTSVSPPTEEFSTYQSGGGLLFPFAIEYSSETGVTITRCYNPVTVLVPGDRIVRINGYSMDSLACQFLRGFSGERTSYREHRVAGWMQLLLWLHRIDPPYDLLIQLRGSREQTNRHVDGVSRGEMTRGDSLLAKEAGSGLPYQLERTGENIGYINFRAMVNLDRFNKFLLTTFAGFQINPPRGVIIDLRNNGGGDSRLGDALLSFLTDSSFRSAQRKEWKMSAEYKTYLRMHLPWWIRWMPLTWVSAEARKYLGADDGAIVIDTSAPETPGPNSLRFRGKTCFLIGPKTFSSAMMLANAVGDYHLATLIGEETGGIPNAFGEVYPFDLPNTRLLVGVSSAYFVRANGDGGDHHGVLPDIEVRQSPENDQAGVDAVMERARRWILEE